MKRFVELALALILLAVAPKIFSAEPNAPIKNEILESIERELSTPICGVGYLQTRKYQLKQLGDFNKMPYLVHIAQKEYKEKKKSYLPKLAIRLIAEQENSQAQNQLRTLHQGSHHGLLVAQLLAMKFQDTTGLETLKMGLKSEHTQVRADTLHAVSKILDENNVSLVLPLAKDKDFYVLQRFEIIVNENMSLLPLLAKMILDAIDNSEGETAARLSMTLLLIGDASHLKNIESYLLSFDGPATVLNLYHHAQWCDALARKGYKSGLEGAIHILNFWPKAKRKNYLWYTIGIVAYMTPYDTPKRDHDEAHELQAAKQVIAWWEENKDKLSYDQKKGRFVFKEKAVQQGIPADADKPRR